MLSVQGRLTGGTAYDTDFLEKFENDFCFIVLGNFYKNFCKLLQEIIITINLFLIYSSK